MGEAGKAGKALGAVINDIQSMRIFDVDSDGDSLERYVKASGSIKIFILRAI